MQFQTFLPHSKRGIKFKILSASTRDNILDNAAKLVGENGSMIELRAKEQRMGVKAMIVAVTDAGVEEKDYLTAKWKKLSVMDLDDKYDDMFSAKDHLLLAALYRHHHEVTMDEVTAIVGKTLPVSED